MLLAPFCTPSCTFHTYCRGLNGRERHTARLAVDENDDLPERLLLSDESDGFETRLAEMETTELLRSCTGNDSGVTRLGVEALCLKAKGVSITEMAALYDVPSSYVGTWISRTVQKLHRDENFLAAFR